MPQKVFTLKVRLNDDGHLGADGECQREFFPDDDVAKEFINRVGEAMFEIGGELGVFLDLGKSRKRQGKVIPIQ